MAASVLPAEGFRDEGSRSPLLAGSVGLGQDRLRHDVESGRPGRACHHAVHQKRRRLVYSSFSGAAEWSMLAWANCFLMGSQIRSAEPVCSAESRVISLLHDQLGPSINVSPNTIDFLAVELTQV